MSARPHGITASTKPSNAVSVAAVSVLSRPGALLLVYAYRLLSGLVIASPLVASVSASGIGRFPGGDAALFESGGAKLIQVVHASYAALLAASRESSLLLVAFAALGVVPYACWLFALGHGGRLSLSEACGRAMRALPRLVLLSGISLLICALIVVLASLGLRGLSEPLSSRLDERSADLWRWSSLLLWLPVWALVSILTELARAAVVQHDAGVLRAMRSAWQHFRQRKLVLFSAWLTPLLWSIAAIAGAALLVEQLAVDRPGSFRVVGVWVVHQAVVVLMLVLRGTWLTRALSSTGAPI